MGIQEGKIIKNIWRIINRIIATGPQTPKSLKYARVISVFPLVKTLMVVSTNSLKDGRLK
jgi:hypothetical protein